ncbi:MAG TPA: prepilin peptidase [Gemmatimonadaceae bacterium]|nr:prepilin peptidase [Gemmatimonadaceae bacterium]
MDIATSAGGSVLTNFRGTDFTSSMSAVLAGACLTALLATAAAGDVRSRRIPNRLVLWIGALGVVYSIGSMPIAAGLERALLGLAIGFTLWIPFYAFGMLGAGDVKLFAAGSCWFAPSQVVGAALISALCGGLLSVVALVLAHGAGITMFRMAQLARDPSALASPMEVPEGRPTLPYGIALAVGLAVAGWFPQLIRLT